MTNFPSKTYYIIEHTELNKLIEEHLPKHPDWEDFVYNYDATNGALYQFSTEDYVEPKITKSEIACDEIWLETDKFELPYVALGLLEWKGVIPGGNYLVKVCW